MSFLFKSIGALGIILISIGLLHKNKKIESIYYIFGGIALETYSIYIQDPIFIGLQGIFIMVAIYELHKVSKK